LLASRKHDPREILAIGSGKGSTHGTCTIESLGALVEGLVVAEEDRNSTLLISSPQHRRVAITEHIDSKTQRDDQVSVAQLQQRTRAFALLIPIASQRYTNTELVRRHHSLVGEARDF
jgi:hypothetical protein